MTMTENLFHQQLFAAVEQGLPLLPQPYLAIAEQIGASEDAVINTLNIWQQQGLIRRLGLVVRHRKLGYCANAMVVWNVTDTDVDDIGDQLAGESVVTLCYQRARVLPHWQYNLFCMIHGKDKATVLQQLADICQRHQLESIEKEVLFSVKAYKQQGGRFSSLNKQGKALITEDIAHD
ncbi:MAG: AsnC family protein [Gammaproteobacteria bacterium]|nr:MAG: AsnC family protein [Gammaproteobacteria bacterium]